MSVRRIPCEKNAVGMLGPDHPWRIARKKEAHEKALDVLNEPQRIAFLRFIGRPADKGPETKNAAK